MCPLANFIIDWINCRGQVRQVPTLQINSIAALQAFCSSWRNLRGQRYIIISKHESTYDFTSFFFFFCRFNLVMEYYKITQSRWSIALVKSCTRCWFNWWDWPVSIGIVWNRFSLVYLKKKNGCIYSEIGIQYIIYYYALS
jgi:hypothetical protein